MAAIRTLEQRRLDKIAAIRDGVAAMAPRLADYATKHGGRFILFGSAVTGPLHDLSDVDIIADFPQAMVFDACRHADKVCRDLGLVPDVRPVIWTSPTVLQRALETGRVLA
jgi:predicted nucleotidyltransferase